MEITKGPGKRYHIAMVRGDYESIGINLTEYTPADGDFVELTVRQTPLSDVLIYKKVTDFAEGRALIEFLPDDTEPLAFGRYVYDIQLTYSGGKPKTIVKLSDFVLEKESTYGSLGNHG